MNQRQAAQKTEFVGEHGDEYLEELRNDHLGLVGGSSALVALRDLIRRVAASARPVLVSGPTGAGKSLVTDAISRLSGRTRAGEAASPSSGSDENVRNGTALARVNCRAVDEKSLEQLLFGTESHIGLLGAPGNSCLVLDDVDALPEGVQAKMVRVLQSGSFRPIGASAERRVSIRVLAVTSRSLPRCVRENTFRADLLYELGVLTVSVPGLDEHRDDIPALVNHFLRLEGTRLRLSGEALDILVNRAWPGGVRELRNLVERAVVQTRGQLADGVIDAKVIGALCAPEPMDGAIDHSLLLLAERLLHLPIGNKLAAVEAALLESAMRASRGNKSAAARMLGLHRKAVERKLEKYEVRFVPGGGPVTALSEAVSSPSPELPRHDASGRSAVGDSEILGRHGREALRLQT
ncbi:MAG: sigma 54-interacting transcriptional regulator [Myxococcales bacterium]